METLTVAEARRTFGDVISKVGYGGKRIVVQRHGKPVAAVISFEDMQKLEEFERQRNERYERGMAALREAQRVSELIFRERNGEYLPDSAEVIREMREERVDEILGLR